MQQTVKPLYSHSNAPRGATFIALGMALCMLVPEISYATNPGVPMASVFCMVFNIVSGNLGRGIATLAVVALGVGAMLGKVSWGLALMLSGGIAVVFSAADIIDYLTATAITNDGSAGLVGGNGGGTSGCVG